MRHRKPVPGIHYRKVWRFDATPWRRRVREYTKFRKERLTDLPSICDDLSMVYTANATYFTTSELTGYMRRDTKSSSVKRLFVTCFFEGTDRKLVAHTEVYTSIGSESWVSVEKNCLEALDTWWGEGFCAKAARQHGRADLRPAK